MDDLTKDFIKIILVCLVIFGVGYGLSVLTDQQAQQDAASHPGCTKIEIHMQRDYGYGWLCPTPTRGK